MVDKKIFPEIRKISGNGMFTKKCQEYFENKYDFKKTLLTSSCTDALEMCAILADLKIGDEVIMPSFTFVSTAIAFIRQGAKVVFADSYYNNPNINVCCDRCQKKNLYCSIGLIDKDLCLKCTDEVIILYKLIQVDTQKLKRND